MTDEKSKSNDSVNSVDQNDPAFAAAEQLFSGTSFRTGVAFKYPSEQTAPTSRKIPALQDGPTSKNVRSQQELYMRVRPRRDGKQLQISLVIHRSPFMREASRVISAAQGVKRAIGFDYLTKDDVKRKNLARFEAPELVGMVEPVARFRWIADEENVESEILQYELFDAHTSPAGGRILHFLEVGIGAVASTNLANLSKEHTVISKKDRAVAQWYRLS